MICDVLSGGVGEQRSSSGSDRVGTESGSKSDGRTYNSGNEIVRDHSDHEASSSSWCDFCKCKRFAVQW